MQTLVKSILHAYPFFKINFSFEKVVMGYIHRLENNNILLPSRAKIMVLSQPQIIIGNTAE